MATNKEVLNSEWDRTPDELFVQRPYIPPDPRDESDFRSIFDFFRKHPLGTDDDLFFGTTNEVDDEYVAALRSVFPDVGSVISAAEVTRYKVTIFGLEVIRCGRVLVPYLPEGYCGYRDAVVVRLPDGYAFDIFDADDLAELREKLNLTAERSPNHDSTAGKQEGSVAFDVSLTTDAPLAPRRGVGETIEPEQASSPNPRIENASPMGR